MFDVMTNLTGNELLMFHASPLFQTGYEPQLLITKEAFVLTIT